MVTKMPDPGIPAGNTGKFGKSKVQVTSSRSKVIKAHVAADKAEIEKKINSFNGVQTLSKDREELNAQAVTTSQNSSGQEAATSQVVVPMQDVMLAPEPPVLAGQTQLEFTARKVREIRGEVRNVEATVIENKVIIQGTVHKQIFYVDLDGIVRHQAEDIRFSTFVDIPGAMPGMNVLVNPVIEDIIFRLINPPSRVLMQKVVLQIFVKVTDTVQLQLAVGDGPLFKTESVIGEGSTQVLSETVVNLENPAQKVAEIVARVQDVTSEIIDDKVIVQGIIHKQIFYVDLDGVSRHQAEEVPFSTFLDIPGAADGQNVQVHPNVEFVGFILEDETTLRQKVVLEIFVKVTETIQIQVQPGNGPLLAIGEVVGEGTTQLLSDTVTTLIQPAIKVREVVAEIRDITTHVLADKVVIQGTLHKQIFFINEDNIEVHQPEDVPFSTFIDIPGALPGLNVQVHPFIEFVGFNFTEPDQLNQKVVMQFFVKVTEPVQIQVALGNGPLVKVEEVIGENAKQILVERPVRPVVIPIRIRRLLLQVVEAVGEVVERQIIVENVVDLPVQAIKVAGVTATIEDLTAQVVPNGIIIQGNVVKQVRFVDTDGIVRDITETVPFSLLLTVPGIDPAAEVEVEVAIENITLTLSEDGRTLNQLIVVNAVASITNVEGIRRVSVISEITGPGITSESVTVRAQVVTDDTVETRVVNVVTDVQGPGIVEVIRETLLLDVVDDGNPNPVPVSVVTDVRFA
ncbi:MAG: DUF3794 domain-containing protein [Firmicutes bacterium]|nr:DUF3794 domain-containing protein [Bacillota bacterium]